MRSATTFTTTESTRRKSDRLGGGSEKEKKQQEGQTRSGDVTVKFTLNCFVAILITHLFLFSLCTLTPGTS